MRARSVPRRPDILGVQQLLEQKHTPRFNLTASAHQNLRFWPKTDLPASSTADYSETVARITGGMFPSGPECRGKPRSHALRGNALRDALRPHNTMVGPRSGGSIPRRAWGGSPNFLAEVIIHTNFCKNPLISSNLMCAGPATRPIGGDRLQLPRVNEPTQVVHVPRRDDHLEAVLSDQQRLRRKDHIAVQRRAAASSASQTLQRRDSSFVREMSASIASAGAPSPTTLDSRFYHAPSSSAAKDRGLQSREPVQVEIFKIQP